MQFMFFLSGLFVWPSLQRKGWKGFLAHRLVRLGIPFVIGVFLVMPIAFYPVYRVTAVDPSWSSFWAHWTALPITPTGPVWFLWFLIALDFCAAAIFKLASGGGGFVADLIEKITQQPRKLFAIVVCITALAYLPLSALYSPWYWAQIGPFEVQATFAPQGLDRGIFDEEGTLVRRWPLWTAAAFAAFFLWIIPAALIAKVPNVPVKALSVIGDLGLVIFAAAACLSMTGLFATFRARPPAGHRRHFRARLRRLFLPLSDPAVAAIRAARSGYAGRRQGDARAHRHGVRELGSKRLDRPRSDRLPSRVHARCWVARR